MTILSDRSIDQRSISNTRDEEKKLGEVEVVLSGKIKSVIKVFN